MSELPPPTGRPRAYALDSDPWAEQARRHERHRIERRTRRRRRLVRFGSPLAVLTAVAVAVAAAVATTARDQGAVTELDEPTVASTLTATTEATTDPVAVPPLDAAAVDEVWLLDRGDGTADWGAILSSSADVVRRDLAVTVTVLGAGGDVVFADRVAVPQLGANASVVIGGVFDVDSVTPARIEIASTLGVAVPDAVAARFDVVEVRRVPSGQLDRDDRLLGTIDLVDGEPVPMRLAALWRDADGRVVAAVFDDVDAADGDSGSDFSLRLPRAVVPPGEPDAVVASVGEPPG